MAKTSGTFSAMISIGWPSVSWSVGLQLLDAWLSTGGRRGRGRGLGCLGVDSAPGVTPGGCRGVPSHGVVCAVRMGIIVEGGLDSRLLMVLV